MFQSQDYGQEHSINDLHFIPFEQDHGTCKTTGYRFGDFGYSVDMFDLDEGAIDILRGIKIWIVDCAGYKDKTNRVHAHLDTIYRLNEEIGAGQVYLTSLTLGMDYRTLLDELPEGYIPAYDGLELNI